MAKLQTFAVATEEEAGWQVKATGWRGGGCGEHETRLSAPRLILAQYSTVRINCVDTLLVFSLEDGFLVWRPGAHLRSNTWWRTAMRFGKELGAFEDDSRPVPGNLLLRCNESLPVFTTLLRRRVRTRWFVRSSYETRRNHWCGSGSRHRGVCRVFLAKRTEAGGKWRCRSCCCEHPAQARS